MVECGSISEPPNFQNLTIWGIVTLVIMVIVGVDSIYGLQWAFHFSDGLYSVLGLIASGCGVAGLVLVILSIVYHNTLYMTISIFCFLISSLVGIVMLIFYIAKGDDLNGNSILHLALSVFICVLFYLQNKGFSPSAAA